MVIIDHGFKEMKRRIIQAATKDVVIGIMGASAQEVYPDSKSDFRIVDVAAVNEFGSDDGVIPERPVHRLTFKAKEKEAEQMRAKTLRLITEGMAPKKALDQFGFWYVGVLQRAIRDYDEIPNKKSTIRRKKSANPLVDSKRMINSIIHEIR